jgi:hypothetical protein
MGIEHGWHNKQSRGSVLTDSTCQVNCRQPNPCAPGGWNGCLGQLWKNVGLNLGWEYLLQSTTVLHMQRMPFSTNTTPYRTVDSSLTALSRKTEQNFPLCLSQMLLPCWPQVETIKCGPIFQPPLFQLSLMCSPYLQYSGWPTDIDASLRQYSGWLTDVDAFRMHDVCTHHSTART